MSGSAGPQYSKALRAPGRRPGLLDPAPAAPQGAIFFVPPAKGSAKTRPYPPYGAATLGRQPRRQRRVARPSAAATVCTENRENPRATPFRILLPRPPGGGLGAGGVGGDRCKPSMAQKIWKPPRPRRNKTKPSAPRAADRLPWPQRLQRPNRPFSSYLPPRAARRQDHTHPMVLPRWAASHAVSAVSPAHRPPQQCARKTAKIRAPRHFASHSPGPLEGA